MMCIFGFCWLQHIIGFDFQRIYDEVGFFFYFGCTEQELGIWLQDEIIKEMLSSFLLFLYIFLLCCDENLWWITFSLCLLYMNEALFQKYIFLNFFFVITYYLWFAKEYVSGRSMLYVWVSLFLSHASKFNAKKI